MRCRVEPVLVLVLFVLVVVGVAAGCQRQQAGSRTAVDSVPPPASADLYPPAVATPAESDPFAQPGVFTAPVDGGQGAVFTTPATGGGTYQVQKGDTLWKIATQVYGDGQKWKDIAAANPGLDPDRVRAGQTITLP